MKARTIVRNSTLLLAAALVSAVAQWPPSSMIPRIEPAQRPVIVCASWYRVPADSIARRRAGVNELTAAHNRLPLGTLVLVTNLSNNKSAIVRITDRGIPPGQCTIDICQEAAQQIGSLREGVARVRLEVLPSSIAILDPDAHHPAAP